MKSLIVRRLLLATFIASTYNTLSYFYAWIKYTEHDYADLSLWALFPQNTLSIIIFYLWRKDELSPNLNKFFRWVLSLWLVTYLLAVLSWYPYFIEIGKQWPGWSSFAQGFGFPIFISGAPLNGLFHSPIFYDGANPSWFFDGGISFSWLVFNILATVLIFVMYRFIKSLNLEGKSKKIFSPVEAKDGLICTCATPVVGDSSLCGSCGGAVSSKKVVHFKKNAGISNGSSVVITCDYCESPITEAQKFCPNCGEPIKQKRPAFTEFDEVECDQCGADLLQNQKFCASCGVEIIWPEVPLGKLIGARKIESEPISETNKNIKILAGVIGLVILYALFSSNFWSSGGNQQEECFNREMLKIGAYADPKGWAVQSRLYCASLHP